MKTQQSEHYILTRFNLRLWTKDKHRNNTRTKEWLKNRFELFEQFCLPSIINQTNQNFKWIVLFDINTPNEYKDKIRKYEKICMQFCPCFVEANKSRYFVHVFKEEIAKRINKDTRQLITSYLDNDDALHKAYVEEVQQMNVSIPTFISHVYGIQYFTELNIATRVPYTNNHFISLIEPLDDNKVFKTVYGYGSHIAINKYKKTKTIYLNNPKKDRWIEVIHEANMDNDVKMTFDTKLITDINLLKNEYGIDIRLSKHSKSIFYSSFLFRAFKEIFRHIKLKITGRRWD